MPAPPFVPLPVPGLRVPATLDVVDRPRVGPSVRNPETGGTSTVYSMSFGTPEGEVLIPRVSPDGRFLTEPQAIALYRRTGQHLGIFDTPAAADRFARLLHENQAAIGSMGGQ